MRGQNQALHVGEYLELEILRRLISMFKVIEKERKFASVLPDKVEDELLLQSFTQLGEEPVFLLEGAEVVLEASIEVLEHHLDLPLLHGACTLDLANLDQEELGSFEQLQLYVGDLGLLGVREDSSQLLTEVGEEQLRTYQQAEGVYVLPPVCSRDVSITNSGESGNHKVYGAEVLALIVIQWDVLSVVLHEPTLESVSRLHCVYFFEGWHGLLLEELNLTLLPKIEPDAGIGVKAQVY